jgi:murein L,D-transpeptidase YcbB/YkuD
MRFLRSFLLIALLGATITGTTRFVSHRPAAAPTPDTPAARNLAGEISALLNAGAIPGAPTTEERAWLEGFYPPDTSAPVWVTTEGDLTAAGRQTAELLAGADSHGLNPDHYRVAAAPEDGAMYEVAVTLSMRRFLQDIGAGRVNPASLGIDLPTNRAPLPSPTAVRDAAVAGKTTASLTAVMPTLGNYEGVRRALATYRVMAQQAEPDPLSTPASSIHMGDPLPWGSALRSRLEQLGDLPPTANDGGSVAIDDVYSSSLEIGVKSFQRRHNLVDDGVIGKGTVAALNVPIATRMRQLEMALERLRWLPRDLDGPVVLVNVPMYRLWAWDSSHADVPTMTMRVVVGTAGRNATPVLASTFERVIFRPYWNVPRSIVINEILPKVKADPGYLAAHRYELVRGQTDRGEVVAVTPGSLAELEQGALRVRQQPGPTNSLGLVKFDFPNRHDVFLHDTPSTAAFARDGRALSHGCVRVQDPLGLASWLLGPDTWSREAAQAATQQRDAQSVRLPRPVHLLVTYSTASVDADGTVRFASDIYGQDKRLDGVLRR